MVSLFQSPSASLRRIGGGGGGGNRPRSQSSLIRLKTLAFWVAGGTLVMYWSALVWFFGTHLLPGSKQRTLRGSNAADPELQDIKSRYVTDVQPKPPSLSPNVPVHLKYLMFLPIPDGQGLGNIMNGLLAAHLFADEFKRRLCVSQEFKGFHMAFQPGQDGILEECALLPQKQGSRQGQGQGIALFNYGYPPNECQLRDQLASDNQIIFYVGNTYPRWPVVPERYFETLYRPRPLLLAMLPWKTAPETVVHLRQPDASGDRREGLDDTTLDLLGKTLPRETFLVTNRVEWYDRFESKFGWSHPEWDQVFHSATSFGWGARNNTTHRIPTAQESELLRNLSVEEQRSLQMFCDWYTISQGKHVLHTHSDFSISGIHFMNIHNSQTILGTNENNQLKLVEESWRRDGETARLVDRGPDNLRLCSDAPKTPAF